MMPENTTTIIRNRYPGVKPFSLTEDFLFFGRGSDIETLNRRVFINQAVVLFGKSGYGKSSLINAGIIPKLKEKNVCYFSIRFNNYSEKEADQNLSPSQTVKQRLAENITPEKDNVLDRLIPNENSFWYWIKQVQLQTRKSNFIIFFDQFEELFTYPKEQVDDFSEQLSTLLYDTVPLKYKDCIAALEMTDEVSNEQHDFLYEKPDVKVIFSIRSDRLSLLNTLTDRHPGILKKCYELDALNAADARKAIIEPALLPQELGFETPTFTFTENAVDKILKSIANPDDGKIEAATLQIVCRYVEDNLVCEKKLVLIDENDLGDITDIFQQYYEGILAKLTKNERSQAQHLIEDELIDNDRRNPLTAAYIKSKFRISDELLQTLEQSSLLRKERDAAGRLLYEVSHDTLIAAINKVAEGRRIAEEQDSKLDLERKIQEERKRSEELLMLNRKAKKRVTIVFSLALVCIAIAVVAIIFFKRAIRSEANVREEEKVALDAYQQLQQQKDKTKKLLDLYFSSQADTSKDSRELSYFYELINDSSYKARQYDKDLNILKLQEEYFAIDSSQSDITKDMLSSSYQHLGWQALFKKRFADAQTFFEKSIFYDPTYVYPQCNLPHAYLFTNQFERAKAEYLRLKNLPFDTTSSYPTFKDAFLADFKDFKKAGIVSEKVGKEMDEIVRLLNGN